MNQQMKLRSLRAFAMLPAIAAICAFSALAGGGEISGHAGMFRFTDGGGETKFYGGGGLGLNLGKRVVLFGEFDHVPMGKESYNDANGAGRTTGEIAMKLQNIGGGARILFGSSESKVQPYIVGAVGGGRLSVSGDVKYTPVRGSATSVSTSASSWAVYSGIGGGVYLNVNKKFAIRPEFRYQRYQSTDLSYSGSFGSGFNSMALGVGVCYRFGN
jgi:opacity protein-like surface antigen